MNFISAWTMLLGVLLFYGVGSTELSAAPKAKRVAVEQAINQFSGKKIDGFDVRGNKRIEKDAILAKLISKVGDTISSESVRADLRAIFSMGFFETVEIEADTKLGKLILTLDVHERPVISKIDFEGNERLSTNDLKEVSKVKEWSILDVNKVKEDLSLIQKHYEEKGFFVAKVNYQLKAGKEDEVELTYKINDYEKVQIKKITFLNNKRFGDAELKAVLMDTREGGMFSFLNGTGSFKESAFKQDMQRLTYFYLDHGYVKFRPESPVITVSDDKRFLYISIYVDEGEQYNMGTFDFSGDLLFPKDELATDLSLLPNEMFSISKRNYDIQKLTERYQDLGYAFVNVIPKMDIKDDTKIVNIDYSFEKGNLVYFNKINMAGNSKTYDKVIRRELKIKEGELFSGSKLRESRENVERLGYFAPGEVAFNQLTPKGRNDVVDIEIAVKERSTGTITLGAGYGSVQKFFFTTQVSEINLLGRGQTVSLAAQVASDRYSKSFNLGFTDPYAFDTRWSMGGDFYYVTFPIPGKYNTRKLGLDGRLGHPIYDYTNFFLTYKNEGLQIEQADPTIDPAEIAADQGVLSSLVWSVVRDKRNNRFETTDGNYQSVSLETAGIGGDKKFLKWNLNNRYYKRVIGDLVFRNSLEYGQIERVADKVIPPSERFYLGGPNNLRGFNLFSVGPYKTRFSSPLGRDIREPLGGSVEMLALFELEHPLIREAGLKWVIFYDAGNTFTGFPKGRDFAIRTDAGLGFRWFSPIGPLRFEWGFAFNRREDEDPSVFSFFIGPPF